jgi:hypothetical protein
MAKKQITAAAAMPITSTICVFVMGEHLAQNRAQGNAWAQNKRTGAGGGSAPNRINFRMGRRFKGASNVLTARSAAFYACLATTLISVHPSAASPASAAAQDLLPPPYRVIRTVCGPLDGGSEPICVAAFARKDEDDIYKQKGQAPPRPLLIYRRVGRANMVLGRNDHVVLRLDEGGQCDPFDDGVDGLKIKGRYFTVQNAVACGSHWTDFITFHFDASTRAFVFHSEIIQNWTMSEGHDPNADGLVPGKADVRRADPARPVTFGSYRPKP